jgi:hypothetical protein
MKEAFLHYLAAVAHRPGDDPTVRQPFLHERLERLEHAQVVLASVDARHGEHVALLWTSGPWEYRAPAGGETSYGRFVTLWARPIEWVPDEEMVWRVAVDLGISHAKPAKGLGMVPLERGPAHAPMTLHRAPGAGYGVGVGTGTAGVALGTGVSISARDQRWREMKHAVNELLNQERSYGFDLRLKGASTAIARYAAEDVRLYRDGSEPTLGKLEAIAALDTMNRDREWISLGSRVSTSYDLGGSWGLARSRNSPPDTSAFLHLWRRDPHKLSVLVLDIENEYPKR